MFDNMWKIWDHIHARKELAKRRKEKMKLSSLMLHPSYAETNSYRCKVTFTDPSGEITLNLPDELSDQILEICKEKLVAATAKNMDQIRSSFEESPE